VRIFATAMAVAGLVAGATGGTAAAKQSGHLAMKIRHTTGAYPTALTVQPDDAIVVSGVALRRNGSRVLLARFLPGGRLDPTFAGGRLTSNLGHTVGAYAVARQPDGKLVVAGYARTSGTSSSKPQQDFLVARYLPDGSLDPSFGSGGASALDFGANDYAAAVDLDPGGRIVVAGVTDYPGKANPDASFAIARLTPDGRPDPSFGSGGEVTTSFGGYSGARSVTVLPDGSIAAAGVQTPDPDRAYPGRDSLVLARYTASGSPDSTFGNAGTLLRSLSAVQPGNGVEDVKSLLLAVAMTSDGSTVASAFTEIERRRDNPTETSIARFSPGGGADLSFGGDGYVTERTLPQLYATVLLPSEDGSVHAAGSCCFRHRFGELMRLTSTGLLDTEFGRRGAARVPFRGVYGLPTAAGTDSAGRVVLAGTAGSDGDDPDSDAGFLPTRIALARYTTDGRLDPTFGRRVRRHRGDGRLRASASGASRPARSRHSSIVPPPVTSASEALGAASAR
jgi:uncharacterized delta-60 repeat protein